MGWRSVPSGIGPQGEDCSGDPKGCHGVVDALPERSGGDGANPRVAGKGSPSGAIGSIVAQPNMMIWVVSRGLLAVGPTLPHLV